MNEVAQQLADQISNVLYDKKALDTLVLDVHDRTIVADAFVVSSGRTAIQVRALSDSVEESLQDKNIRPLRKEGYAVGRWIILDYGSVLVHIFQKEDREFYNLERLWSNGTNIRSVGEPSL